MARSSYCVIDKEGAVPLQWVINRLMMNSSSPIDFGRGARWSSGQCARRAIAEAKQRSQCSAIGWVTNLLSRASEGTLSRWSRLHLQSLAPTNPHWARVVGYGPFSLWVIHKEGLCPSSGDINRLMMIDFGYLPNRLTELPRILYRSFTIKEK
jgi:hypothetical protein